MAAPRPAPGAQAIRRAVAVLRILAMAQERGARLTDVMQQAGLTRATAHRILRVLVDEGAVEQEATSRRYMIGAEISLLGLARTARFPIRGIADPYLRALADEVGDTVFLTIRNGLDSICIDRKTGSYPVKVLSLEIGGRRPLGVGVAGVALLASLPPAEAASIIAGNAARSGRHGVSSERLSDAVALARARGYALAEVGIVRGTRAIAVPILDASGAPVAAVSIAAVTARLSPARVALVASLMREQAACISARLAQARRSAR